MKLISKFVVREVGGSVVAVATGKASMVFKGVIKLNSVSRFLFDKLQKDVTEQELVDELQKEYAVDEETAKKDVKDFIGKLQNANILC